MFEKIVLCIAIVFWVLAVISEAGSIIALVQLHPLLSVLFFFSFIGLLIMAVTISLLWILLIAL